MSGNYECKCFHCRSVFYGHKHETTCPACAKKFKEFQERIILEKAIELNQGLHSETATLRERVGQLEKEMDVFKSLSVYSQHTQICNTRFYRGEASCDCGYRDLINKLSPQPKEANE